MQWEHAQWTGPPAYCVPVLAPPTLNSNMSTTALGSWIRSCKSSPSTAGQTICSRPSRELVFPLINSSSGALQHPVQTTMPRPSSPRKICNLHQELRIATQDASLTLRQELD